MAENQEIKTAVEKKLENIEEMKIEEIEEIIFTDQVEIGEFERENFFESETEMGVPFIKKGRIPFNEVEEIAPTICEFLKDSINPNTTVKDVLKMKTQDGVNKINNKISKSTKIRSRDKQSIMERNQKINRELKALEEKKVKINRNLFWSIYKIMRGEKRLNRFEEDGKDIELLKLQNSFINNETLKELQEMRSEWYENQS